jgi:hypothetical protein
LLGTGESRQAKSRTTNKPEEQRRAEDLRKKLQGPPFAAPTKCLGPDEGVLTAAYLAPIATTYPGVTRSLGYPDGKRSSKRGSRSHTEEYADGKGEQLGR